jgi:uncharacterized membrane protein
MGKILLVVFILIFIPYLALTKARQLKSEKQARTRYYIFIIVVVALLILLIRIL